MALKSLMKPFNMVILGLVGGAIAVPLGLIGMAGSVPEIVGTISAILIVVGGIQLLMKKK